MIHIVLNFIITAIQFVFASFLFIAAFIVTCIFLTFILACVWELFIAVAHTFKVMTSDTNGNRIRKMGDKEMAEYFLANYEAINHFKGKMNSANALTEWLASKD